MQKENIVPKKKSPKKFQYKEGDVFGRLTLTGVTYMKEMPKGEPRRVVEAICECGVVREYIFDCLRKGDTKSCGCFQRDSLRAKPNARKHGLKGHPLYKVWDGIKGRCYHSKHISYKWYGAKGVTICEEWLNDFKKFYDWAIGAGWKNGLTIDRFPDTKGNYEPTNCRIANTKTQRLNRKDIKFITAFGETKCLQDWSEDKRCAVTQGGLKNRFGRDKAKWPDPEAAITTPPIERAQIARKVKNVRNITAFGETKCLAAWSGDERCIVSSMGLRKRIKEGWNVEEAISTPPLR